VNIQTQVNQNGMKISGHKVMRVKCIANRLSDEQKKECNEFQLGSSKNSLIVGETYTVMGLTVSGGCYFGGLAYEIADGTTLSYITTAPYCLFEIVDDRPSKYWRAKRLEDDFLAFWPEEFYSRAFHDRLSDDKPEEVQVFLKIKSLLEKEFEEPGDS